MRIFVEDWAPGYGSPYLVASEGAEEPAEAARVVEDGGQLRPHAAGGDGGQSRPGAPSGDGGQSRPGAAQADGATPARVAFVDGVRRVESHLYAETDGGALARGVAGAHAYGAAVADRRGRCRFERCRTARLVIWSHDHPGRLPDVAGGWSWEARSVASTEPEAPSLDLQRRMRQAEGRLAEELCADGWLTVVDGPLNYVRSRDLPVIGLVKTHHRPLLRIEDHARVPSLGPAERTSLFALRDDVYACYLRLATPARYAGPWSGIVRLDLPASVGVVEAARTADVAAVTLPAFAGVPHADPRAPQNLQPIGALERHLRRRLGDVGLAARAVRAAVAALREDGATRSREAS